MEEREINSVSSVINLPILCTRGLVCFPHNEINIDVARPKSIKVIEAARNKFSDLLFVTSQIDPKVDNPELKDLYRVGSICALKIIRKNDDGSLRAIILATKRARIREYYDSLSYPIVEVETIETQSSNFDEESLLLKDLIRKLGDYKRSFSNNINNIIVSRLNKGASSEEAIDLLSQLSNISFDKKQELLEEIDNSQRIRKLINYLSIDILENEIENEINKKVRESIDKNQREFVLREKMRAIKEELGDTPSKADDVENIRKLIEENPYPEHIKERVLDELNRYESMPPASSEAMVIRNYIDWVVKIPWYQATETNYDLSNVEFVLNEDHYGLEKIKERILEYLAVQALTKSNKAPIICFVGPPGVGKTSLAQSIARALNRKFVKIALGGVHDEAEIRGHRRTYLGAMPGKIIQGLKKAGTINPVFLLDEIDKLSSDYKGDPSSALLEVLDPEQNKYFSDNFIEESYDLSQVLFIATANYLANVPLPLRDRLEIIELSSYTEIEKLNIAKNHLVNKSIINNGLTDKKIKFSDEAIIHIIRYYTREAGVRNLERNLTALARKVAVKSIKNSNFRSEKITIKKVKEYLGKEKFDYTSKVKNDQIGIVTGLAWTQAGGDILPIEVTHFEGKGGLTITGSLGDVMKESATIALSYVRANAKKFGINPEIFDKTNIHIHCPDGATPKDGPSAGVTMTTAIISSLTNRKVNSSVGMTGEITLRGLVYPIGGLREKSIAAHRSGLKKICIPIENLKDLDEVPDIVKQELEIIPCTTIDDVLSHALVN